MNTFFWMVEGLVCEPVELAIAFKAPRKSEVAFSQLSPERSPLSSVAT